jgi:hypothetical protein
MFRQGQVRERASGRHTKGVKERAPWAHKLHFFLAIRRWRSLSAFCGLGPERPVGGSRREAGNEGIGVIMICYWCPWSLCTTLEPVAPEGRRCVNRDSRARANCQGLPAAAMHRKRGTERTRRQARRRGVCSRDLSFLAKQIKQGSVRPALERQLTLTPGWMGAWSSSSPSQLDSDIRLSHPS